VLKLEVVQLGKSGATVWLGCGTDLNAHCCFYCCYSWQNNWGHS